MTIDLESRHDYLLACEFEAEDAEHLAPKYRVQTLPEELANVVTHGLGFLLAVAGLIALVTKAAAYGSTRHVVGSGIFGATLVITYLASTLYHGARAPRVKHWLRVCDHITIYLLIAGTYTPFLLISLSDRWSWSFFCLVWGLALAGAAFKILAFGKYERLSLASYLGMGWLGVFVVEPLWNVLPASVLILMAAGGLSYTFGVIFYVMHQKRFFHTIWHLFVMVGSACHFAAVLLFVLPSMPAT